MSYQQEYWKRLKENLPELYEEKLAKNRIYNKLRLMNETEEEREKRLRRLREYYKEHRGKTAKQRGKATIPTNSLDEKLLQKYYDYMTYEKGLSTRYIKSTITTLRLFSREYLTPDNLCYLKLNKNLLSKYLIEVTKNKGTANRNKYLLMIRNMFKFFIKKEFVKINPCESFEKAKEPIRCREELSPSNQKRLLSVLPKYDERTQLIVHTLLNTGCRISELLSIKMNDIDMDDRFIRVIGKRNKERYIPINDFLHDIFTEAIKYREEQKIDNRTDYLIYSKQVRNYETEDKPLTPNIVLQILSDIKSKAKITQPLSPHVLRHTFATNLVNKDLDIQIISNILGHDSLDTTMIYAKSNKYRNRDKFININMY